jgi:hypothetical protein
MFLLVSSGSRYSPGNASQRSRISLAGEQDLVTVLLLVLVSFFVILWGLSGPAEVPLGKLGTVHNLVWAACSTPESALGSPSKSASRRCR